MSEYDQASIRLLQAEVEEFQARMADIYGIAIVADDNAVLATTLSADGAGQTLAEIPAMVSIARRLFALIEGGVDDELILAGSLGGEMRSIIIQPMTPALCMIVFTMPGTKIGLMRLDVRYTARQIDLWWQSQQI